MVLLRSGLYAQYTFVEAPLLEGLAAADAHTSLHPWSPASLAGAHSCCAHPSTPHPAAQPSSSDAAANTDAGTSSSSSSSSATTHAPCRPQPVGLVVLPSRLAGAAWEAGERVREVGGHILDLVPELPHVQLTRTGVQALCLHLGLVPSPAHPCMHPSPPACPHPAAVRAGGATALQVRAALTSGCGFCLRVNCCSVLLPGATPQAGLNGCSPLMPGCGFSTSDRVRRSEVTGLVNHASKPPHTRLHTWLRHLQVQTAGAAGTLEGGGGAASTSKGSVEEEEAATGQAWAKQWMGGQAAAEGCRGAGGWGAALVRGGVGPECGQGHAGGTVSTIAAGEGA